MSVGCSPVRQEFVTLLLSPGLAATRGQSHTLPGETLPLLFEPFDIAEVIAQTVAERALA